MKLIEVDISSVNAGKNYRRGFVQDIVSEFKNSGMVAAEVTWQDHYRDTYTCAKCLTQAIQALGLKDEIKAFAWGKNKHVYLVRKGIEA